MRIAIVSDIHGNRTAFEAVLADMEQTSPDLILHGGDLANGGASPAEIVDHLRDLGWPGRAGGPPMTATGTRRGTTSPRLAAILRVLATSRTPDVSRSRRCTRTGRSPDRISAIF